MSVKNNHVYTAKEMCLRAIACKLIGNNETAAMLLQAADALEREERRVKRVKKYEYTTIKSDKTPSMIHDDAYIEGYHAFRREVGEWEVCK